MDFNFYSLALVAGFVIALALSAVILTRRPGPGIVPLACMMAAASIWILGAVFEVSATDISDKIIWNKVSYIGSSGSGVFWLIFALDYSGSSWWKSPKNIFLISIIPLLILIMVWTNEFHHLEWSSVSIIDGPMGRTSVWGKGTLYYVNPITHYILYLAGIIILWRLAKKRTIYRKQVALIIAGNIVPIIGSFLYALRVNIAGRADLTPFLIVFSLIVYSFAILYFRFPDILPIAYKAVIKHIPDGILVIDNQGYIVEANSIAERIIPNRSKPLPGQLLSDAYPDLYRVISVLPEISNSELQTGTDGSSKIIDISTVNLSSNNRETIGKLVVLHDITELKTIQHRLELQYEKEHRLSESLDSEITKRSRYTRALVHELGTPLSTIIASSDLLKDFITGEPQSSLLGNLGRASINLEQRIKELLELARGELGILKIEPERIDVVSVVREIAEEMKPVAAAKGISIRTEIADTSLLAMADMKRLRQILFNLLGNSVKFTTEGYITVRTKATDGNFIRVDVEDTGKGIDKEQMENLFDPYYRQSREATSGSGLGIGLTLSKMYVELHHGEIQVKSAPGQGSVFSFTLPSWQDELPQLLYTDTN